MDKELGNKIVTDISRFSNKKCAVCDTLGNVIASTKDFTLEHSPLDIKSHRAEPLFYERKKIGYLYFDENKITIRENGEVLKSMAELIIQQIYYSKILTSDEKRLDQIVYDYINTENINKKDFRRVLDSFGINLNIARLAIYIEIEEPEYLFLFNKEVIEGEREKKVARIKRSIQNMLNSFYTQHKNNIIIYLGSSNFLIFKDMGDKPIEYQKEFKKTLNSFYHIIKDELRTKITIGVGGFQPKLMGLKESFEEAKTALLFGKQIWGNDKIFHFDSFGVVAPLFAGVNENNIKVSKNLIKKIASNRELLISLKEYLRNDLSLSVTSKKLKIHRNTLVYRLERILSLTGLDPRSFNDAFELKMALLMEEYND